MSKKAKNTQKKVVAKVVAKQAVEVKAAAPAVPVYKESYIKEITGAVKSAGAIKKLEECANPMQITNFLIFSKKITDGTKLKKAVLEECKARGFALPKSSSVMKQRNKFKGALNFK